MSEPISADTICGIPIPPVDEPLFVVTTSGRQYEIRIFRQEEQVDAYLKALADFYEPGHTSLSMVVLDSFLPTVTVAPEHEHKYVYRVRAEMPYGSFSTIAYVVVY